MRDRYTSIVDVLMLPYRQDGRMPLLRRAQDQYAPGQLTVVGGHLEEGESPLEGAIREAEEELGIRINPHDAEFCGLFQFVAADGSRRLGTAWVTRYWEGTPTNSEPDKHSELLWAEPGDPPQDCHPYTQGVLRHFVEGTLYAVIKADPTTAGDAA
ncbi:NUDIX domain-containing protein [Streptomyces sp. NPDC091376]|uniref:NUDIX domain-containing protein n=1 Tax=Streptomyces sp. NPDC091376 TaxID=3365994 RepID=UPI0037F95AB3